MAKAGGAAAAATTTVVNSEQRIRRYPRQVVPERFKDRAPKDRIVELKTMNLNPGANTVNLADWRRLDEDSRVQKDVANGILRELVTPIHKLPPSEAVAIIRNTISKPILEGALAKETREVVRLALRKQLKGIAKNAHDKGQDEAD